MTQETPLEPVPATEPEPAAEKAAERRSRPRWAWAVMGACAAFVAVQAVGILTRDRLERRRPVLAKAPAAEVARPGAVRPPEAPPVGAASRFGPDVVEVVVAGAGSTAPAKPAAEAAPAAEPAAPTPAPAAPPASPSPAPAPTPKAQEANRALLVDVFLSQRYLRETEAQLDALQVAHLRSEIQRPGRGYRVAVASSDEAVRKTARRVLDAAGTTYRATPEGLEVFVYYRDEAQPLAEALGRAGAAATVAPFEGVRPFWRLYAGPFGDDEARRVRKLLSDKGIKTTLEARP